MEYENREGKPSLSTNLDGLTFPKLNLQEEIIRKFEPNLDDFLNEMDPRGDKMPDFIDAKLPDAFKILDEEILTYLCIKLKASGLPDESISILVNILSNAKMHNLSDKPIQKIVLQELLMKINKLRLEATSHYIDFGVQLCPEEQDQVTLSAVMIAADRMFIKQDNGCLSTEADQTEIINGFAYLLNTLAIETTKSLKDLILELEDGNDHKIYENGNALNLYGGKYTKFHACPELVFARLEKINQMIEESGRKIRSVITE